MTARLTKPTPRSPSASVARNAPLVTTVLLCLAFAAGSLPAQDAAVFRSVNYPTLFLGTNGGAAVLHAAPDRFRQVPGLAGSGVSLESVDWPGQFLRHQDFRMRLSRWDGSEQFLREATFILRPGFAEIGTFSLESVSPRGFYVRHRNHELWLDAFDTSQLFTEDASFRVEAPPADPGRRPGGRRTREVGPAGTGTGAEFSDRCEVRAVTVRSGWWVDGIRLHCEDDRDFPLRGGPGGGETVFVLEPGERIEAVSGFTRGDANDRIYAVAIHTNRRWSGLIGNNGDPGARGQIPFRIEVPEGSSFAGFFGTADDALRSIGLLVRSERGRRRRDDYEDEGYGGRRATESTHVGPVGARAGHGFEDRCDVRAIYLRTGWWIDRIEVSCGDGEPRPGRGGNGGGEHVLELEPGERITGISGLVLPGSEGRLHALRIHTNQGATELFGGVGVEDAVPFRLDVPEGYEFAGFFGSADEFVQMLGLVVRPTSRGQR
jgi:hypothetical protein